MPTLAHVAGCGGFVVDEGIFPLPTVHILFSTPTDYGMAFDQFEISMPGDAQIYAWFVPAENARATVLFNHGALFNRSSYVGHIALLHDLGCNVMIYDYRGFGESYDAATLDSVVEDAQAALAVTLDRPETTADRIIIYGVSMGTMVSLAQAAENPTGVIGVILEGVVHQEYLTAEGFHVLGIVPSSNAHTRIPPSLDPFVNAPNVSMPKLFIHSTTDHVTPFVGAQKLFELCPEPKQLMSTTGIHGLSMYADPAFAENLAHFMDDLAPRQPH